MHSSRIIVILFTAASLSSLITTVYLLTEVQNDIATELQMRCELAFDKQIKTQLK